MGPHVTVRGVEGHGSLLILEWDFGPLASLFLAHYQHHGFEPAVCILDGQDCPLEEFCWVSLTVGCMHVQSIGLFM